jgi:hypothetical protein
MRWYAPARVGATEWLDRVGCECIALQEVRLSLPYGVDGGEPAG